jgi:hypothetical protein
MIKSKTIDIVFEGDTQEDTTKIEQLLEKTENMKIVTFRYSIVTKDMYSHAIKQSDKLADRIEWIYSKNFDSAVIRARGADHVIEFNVAKITYESMLSTVVKVAQSVNIGKRTLYVTTYSKVDRKKQEDLNPYVRYFYLYVYLYIQLISYPLKYCFARDDDEIIRYAPLRESIRFSIFNKRLPSTLPFGLGLMYENVYVLLGKDVSIVHNEADKRDIYQYPTLSLKHVVVSWFYLCSCVSMMLSWIIGLGAGMFALFFFVLVNGVLNLYLFHKLFAYSAIPISRVLFNALKLNMSGIHFLFSVSLAYIVLTVMSPCILPIGFGFFFFNSYAPHILRMNEGYKNWLLERVCFG